MTIARPEFERRVLAALDARAGADSRAGRRLRHGPHLPAARGCASGWAGRVPVHRRRALGHHAGAAAAHGGDDLALPGAGRDRRRATRRARRSTRCSPSSRARAAVRATPVTFLLDEVLEFRTFENFPGLRHVLRDLVAGLSQVDQPLRADDALRHARAALLPRPVARLEVIPLTPLSADELREPSARAAGDRPGPAARRARADRRTRRLRAGASAEAMAQSDRRRSDQRPGGAAGAGGRRSRAR